MGTKPEHCPVIFPLSDLSPIFNVYTHLERLAQLREPEDAVDECDLNEFYQQVGEKGSPQEFRKNFMGGDGPKLDAMGAYFRDKSIQPPVLFKMHYDLTGRKELEKDEARIEKAVETIVPMALIMIHDLFPTGVTNPFRFGQRELTVSENNIGIYFCDINLRTQELIANNPTAKIAGINPLGLSYVDGVTLVIAGENILEERPQGEVGILVLIDLGLLDREDSLQLVTASLAHEIVGHLPLYFDLDHGILADPIKSEVVAFERTVKWLEKLTKTLEDRRAEFSIVDAFKGVLDRERKFLQSARRLLR